MFDRWSRRERDPSVGRERERRKVVSGSEGSCRARLDAWRRHMQAYGGGDGGGGGGPSGAPAVKG